jgi:hypothetical protein
MSLLSIACSPASLLALQYVWPLFAVLSSSHFHPGQMFAVCMPSSVKLCYQQQPLVQYTGSKQVNWGASGARKQQLESRTEQQSRHHPLTEKQNAEQG